MSQQMSLNSLHSSLSLETAKRMMKSPPSPYHMTVGSEVAAELFEEDGDGNGYSDESGK